MSKCVASKCIWTILFVMTACVVGYMVVNGMAAEVMLSREGMSCDITGNVHKNSAKIELLTEKMDNLKDVKRDLEDIRSKLNGNTDQIDSLRENMLQAKQNDAAEMTALVD